MDIAAFIAHVKEKLLWELVHSREFEKQLSQTDAVSSKRKEKTLEKTVAELQRRQVQMLQTLQRLKNSHESHRLTNVRNSAKRGVSRHVRISPGKYEVQLSHQIDILTAEISENTAKIKSVMLENRSILEQLQCDNARSLPAQPAQQAGSLESLIAVRNNFVGNVALDDAVRWSQWVIANQSITDLCRTIQRKAHKIRQTREIIQCVLQNIGDGLRQKSDDMKIEILSGKNSEDRHEYFSSELDFIEHTIGVTNQVRFLFNVEMVISGMHEPKNPLFNSEKLEVLEDLYAKIIKDDNTQLRSEKKLQKKLDSFKKL